MLSSFSSLGKKGYWNPFLEQKPIRSGHISMLSFKPSCQMWARKMLPFPGENRSNFCSSVIAHSWLHETQQSRICPRSLPDSSVIKVNVVLNLHYGKILLPVVITLMLYFFILNIPNFKNTVIVFNNSRYSCVSYLENTFANIDWWRKQLSEYSLIRKHIDWFTQSVNEAMIRTWKHISWICA